MNNFGEKANIFIDRKSARLDTLIARIRQHIERVRENRAALISTAVTGKIDVRDMPAQPPEREVWT